MRIGWTTGYKENYWGDWHTAPQIGGSERIVIKLAEEYAKEHEVVVRLPYATQEFVKNGVYYVGKDASPFRADVLFCADDFDRIDLADRVVLVACRSDPPRHTDFDEMVFLSQTHARLLGHPDRPVVGGGVALADYASAPPLRVPRRVICTSSPDRCPQASAIGAGFDFVHTYRPVGGAGHEYSRAEVLDLQRTAMVHIYPLDPIRPSDFFSMSVLESMAAGTPVIVSDADAMPELWGETAYVLPNPVDLAMWTEFVERLIRDRSEWALLSRAGRKRARDFTWDKQAARLLNIAVPALHKV